MLNSLLFGAYCASIGGLAVQAAKIKMMDDFEKEVRTYREFDFNNEKLRDDKHKKAIVLATYKHEGPLEEDKVLFHRKIAFFGALDPTRLFTTKIKSAEQFSLQLQSPKDQTLEVSFEKSSKV